MIEIRNLVKVFPGNVHAVNNLTVFIDKGDGRSYSWSITYGTNCLFRRKTFLLLKDY